MSALFGVKLAATGVVFSMMAVILKSLVRHRSLDEVPGIYKAITAFSFFGGLLATLIGAMLMIWGDPF